MRAEKKIESELKKQGKAVLHESWAFLDERISRDSPSLLASRTRIFLDMLVYLFGREGTILISSIAFSFFVSLFPIIILLLSGTNLLGWNELRDLVFDVLGGFFPISQDFIVRNLKIYTRSLGSPQLLSILLIAWAGSTFFFALEAGLDSAYRIRASRHFVHSQLIGTGMAILAGVLVFIAVSAYGYAESWLGNLEQIGPFLTAVVALIVSFALVFSMFLVLYLGLPNYRQPVRLACRTAVFGSVIWLLMNYVFRYSAQSWSLETIYGPFYVSMTLLLWAYGSGCVVLGGARLAADGFFGKPFSKC